MKDNKLLEFEDIKSIGRANISDELFDYFKNAIVSGKLKLGSALPTELELCKHTGVSRSTIREVLSALGYMNLIVRTKRGTFVNNNNLYGSLPFPEVLKKVHYKDIIDFRIALECEIVGFVAKNANDEDIKELQNTLERMKGSRDVNSLIQADTMFHINLGLSSHNELFSNVLEMVRNELESLIYEVFIRDESIRKRAICHHGKILKAIEEGNVKKAKDAMHDHILDVLKTIKKLGL